MSRSTIEFVLNGEAISLPGSFAGRTVLTWLREERRLVGTKEGCAEGDCGACTVALAELDRSGRLAYRPAASCILFVGALDGRELITVEGLDGRHPAQRAMLECHGSQCGFCTPGFVMALYAHYESDLAAGMAALCDALAGNLCRCTGYAPILAAGAKMFEYPNSPAEGDAARIERLRALPRESLATPGFRAPLSIEELALALEPGTTLLAGGTDLGLAVTKAHRDFERIVYLGRVDELKEIREDESALHIGGAVTYAEAHAALSRLHPDIGELVRRLGGAQVRACGTLGGNIANASPIGDSMPVLLALDAVLVLQHGRSIREVKISGFYTGYRRTVLQPGELIRTIRIAKLARRARFAAYKVSKRFDQDISAVCAAFHVDASGEAMFGFGGMAATPARAPRAEKAYAEKGVDAACTALAEDFAPLSDHRASAWYRLAAAQGLLRKFHGGVSSRALLELV